MESGTLNTETVSQILGEIAAMRTNIFMVFAVLAVIAVVWIINTSTRVKDNSWVKIILFIAIGALAFALFLKLRGLLLYVFLGFILSYLLDPVVSFFQRKGVSRVLTTVLLVAILAGILLMVAVQAGPVALKFFNEESRIFPNEKYSNRPTATEAELSLLKMLNTHRPETVTPEIENLTQKFAQTIFPTNLTMQTPSKVVSIFKAIAPLSKEKEGEIRALVEDLRPVAITSKSERKVFEVFEQLEEENPFGLYELAIASVDKKAKERYLQDIGSKKLSPQSLYREQYFKTIEGTVLKMVQASADYEKVKSFVARSAKGFGSRAGVIFFVPLLIFFFLIDGHKFMRTFIAMIPNKYFEMVRILIFDVEKAFGKYISGTFLDCAVIGILNAIALSVVYSLAWGANKGIVTGVSIGLLAGLLNAVPVLGSIVASVISVAPGILDFSLVALIGGALAPVAINQLDNTVVYPLTVGTSVELHPLMVMLALLAGETIGGGAGMIIAIPAVAIGRVFINSLFKQLKGFNFM